MLQTKCPRCQATNGRAHSFQKVATLTSSTNLFYTAPALAEEADDSPDALPYYLAHIEDTRPNPWIWIFDCKGMLSKDLLKNGMGKRLSEVVQTNTFDTLVAVYIVNPTWTIKTLLTFLHPFLRKEMRAKLHVCSLGPLDTLQRIQSLGVKEGEIHSITRLLTR
jgi:hypothetical protein